MFFTDILYVFFTDVFEIGSLGVTGKVVVELVEEHTGNQLCVLGQRQLVWEFGDLAAHLEDLPQTWRPNTHLHEKISAEVGSMQIKAVNAALRLTVINGEERPGVVSLLSDFARNVLAQQVQSLISAVARHLRTRNHLQQRQKNSFKVFRCICNGRASMNKYTKGA